MTSKTTVYTKSPKLTVPEIIEHCKNNLGITFKLMNEEQATEFLIKNNFFFRLEQYCTICPEQTKSGKYVGLDFGHLVELSTIDMHLRKLLLKMTIDFEYYLKVRLVNDCQNNPMDDGYEVVEKFLTAHPKVRESVKTNSRLAGYSGNRFDKYVSSPAVWNFVEMIGFHDFINFYGFYYSFFKISSDYIKHFDSVRRIRNVCAHNVCMLTSFKPVSGFKNDLGINFELLQGNLGIGSGAISNCLKIPLLNDFAVMLSVYTKLVSSAKVKEKTIQEIMAFFDGRMILRREYFNGNIAMKNAYQFARKVLDYYLLK